MNRRWLRVLAATVGVAFVVLPLVGLLSQAPWSRLRSILATSDARQALGLSLVCSTLAAAVSLMVGAPVAWLLATMNGRGRTMLRSLCALALVLPPVVSGVALLAAFGPQGLVGRWFYQWFHVQLTFSTAGVVLAQSFVAFPFVVFTLEAAFHNLDTRTLLAARSFGASAWLRFRSVVIPAIGPSLVAGVVLAWSRALGEFGATVTFAGNLPGKTQTLPLQIYQLQSSDPGAATMLSLVLVAIAVVVIVALRGSWLGAFR